MSEWSKSDGWDESAVRREGNGQFAEKPPAPESGVALSSSDHNMIDDAERGPRSEDEVAKLMSGAKLSDDERERVASDLAQGGDGKVLPLLSEETVGRYYALSEDDRHRVIATTRQDLSDELYRFDSATNGYQPGGGARGRALAEQEQWDIEQAELDEPDFHAPTGIGWVDRGTATSKRLVPPLLEAELERTINNAPRPDPYPDAVRPPRQQPRRGLLSFFRR